MTENKPSKVVRPDPAAIRAALASLRSGDRQPREQGWCKKIYEVEVVTPMMGGGVDAGEPDEEMPVRATEIRAQLRFWWRLLASKGTLPGPLAGQALAGQALFTAERARFGGMGERDMGYAGQLAIRLKKILPSKLSKAPLDYQVKKTVKKTNRGGKKVEEEKWFDADQFRQAPRYALFPARAENQDTPLKLWLAGVNFQLDLEFNPEYREEFDAALNWWASFGGLGARTRRGVGSVRVTRDGTLLDPVTPCEAQAAGGCLLQLRGVSHANSTSDWTRQIGIVGKDDAVTAWDIAIDCLNKFRQGETIGRNPNYGQSRWPEPLAIRKLANAHRIKANGFAFAPDPAWPKVFPRAAFGMPIVFHFKNDRADHPKDPDATLEPTGGGRLSSPLILKAMAVEVGGKTKYVPIALLLPDAHVWTASLELRDVKQDGASLPSPVAIAEWWPASDADRKTMIQRPAINVPGGTTRRPLAPMHEKGGTALDPLRAFLHFFSQP